MRAEASPRGMLEHAFRRFEQAAVHLEERHAGLREKVDRLERQLLDANRRLEAVLDALDGGVAVVSRGGRLLRTNRAFERMELADTRGDLTHPALVGLVQSAASHGGTTRTRRQSATGVRDLAATLIPVGDAEGTRVLTVQDITEIRRQEEEGGRRQRLEALGRMAAELAHEVRNPLGSIRLFASMLEEDLEDHPDRRAMTEQILSATAGLEGTVSNLLAFAAPAGGARRRVDLAVLAVEVCSLLAPACAVRGVRLTGPPPGTGCVVEGEPEGLRQILLNLLGNSLAATGPGGRVAVRLRRTEDRAVLEVADDGKGIDAEDLPRVFDPFFTRTEGGTGLGLSIVHACVERHGGRIALDSRPGLGSRVEVDIPAKDAATKECGEQDA